MFSSNGLLSDSADSTDNPNVEMDRDKIKIPDNVVLIIEGNSAIRSSIENSLKEGHPDYKVLSATDAKTALSFMAQYDISMILLDVHMPEVSGLDLLIKIQNASPWTHVVLMTQYGGAPLRRYIKDKKRLEAFEKPVDIDQIKKLVDVKIKEGKKRFPAEVSKLTLLEIIHICCKSISSLVLQVVKVSDKGLIYIENGEIVNATCAGLTGESAFYDILSWNDSKFTILPTASLPDGAMQYVIDMPWEYLLMEAEDIITQTALKPVPETAKTRNDPKFLQGDFKKKIKVLIVDDSPMMCKVLNQLLSADEYIEVVGMASNGEEALTMSQELKPDLITLDVNMPVMNGDTALKHIMIKSPVPVVIISNPGNSSKDRIIDYLLLGAVDYIYKPTIYNELNKEEIVLKIRNAAGAKMSHYRRTRLKSKRQTHKKPSANQQPSSLVVMISGLGGYSELIGLMTQLPAESQSGVIAIQQTSPDLIPLVTDYINQRSGYLVMPMKEDTHIYANTCCIGTMKNLETQTLHPAADGVFQIGHITGRKGNIDSFLTGLALGYSGSVTVVLFSGAHLGDMSGLTAIRKNNGRILIKSPDTCMAPESLKSLINNGCHDRIAGIDEMVYEIMNMEFFLRDTQIRQIHQSEKAMAWIKI